MSSTDVRRLRREPPPFRRVTVARIEDLSGRMRRIVLTGRELDGFEIVAPAASVRLLLPPADDDEIVMPSWTGNQFELPGGERAPIRTFTPRHFDHDRQELTIDIVLHDHGAASDWARSAQRGDGVAISGPGRGHEIDTSADGYLLAGDETALPAIAQLLEALPPRLPVRVDVEVADPVARIELPPHPHAEVSWHELPAGAAPGNALVATIRASIELPDSIWVAGEAAAVQRIRKHLFEVRGLDRSAVTARGYWKQGRSAT